MKKLGRELNAVRHWEHEARTYSPALKGNYHKHRLDVIRELIPHELLGPGQKVFDFGCGDAIHFSEFLETGARIEGVDISTEMIKLAHRRLTDGGYDDSLVQVADVGYLQSIPSASLDALLSFNVLAYLTDDENKLFYQEASRIVRSGGYLVVTHSNELFDLFSLNRYTLEFFKRYLMSDISYHARLDTLLNSANIPENAMTYNIRENPLTYKYKLAKYGFSEVRQEFINLHVAPPPLLQDKKSYPGTLMISEENRWTLMFVCSTFGSVSIKQKEVNK